MKRNIYIFGGIAGAILGIFVTLFITLENTSHSLDSEVLGYSVMVVAFAFIFVGIKNFRDKYNNGIVTFGKALLIGLGITLIGSTIYVLIWMIGYYFFVPDFMTHYADQMIKEAQASGADPATLAKKIAEVNNVREMYKNPIWVVLFTYLEVAP